MDGDCNWMYKNWFSISNEDSYYFYSIRILKKIPVLTHSRTQSPSYARSTERDKGLWPNPYQTGI
jgi:hypothetical protein